MDFSAGHFPIDIVFFALIAAFLILRLRSVLGKKIGFEQQETPAKNAKPQGAVVETREDSLPPQIEYQIPSADSEIGQRLARIAQIESNFNPRQFLEGAEVAFRKILAAFANEDLQSLRNMLTMGAFHAFESAIHARKDAQETQNIEIKTLHSVAITNTELVEEGAINQAAIEVKFVSDQINVTFDSNKNPVVGTESVTEFIDFWVFERLLGVPNQGSYSWRLRSARSEA